MVYFLDATIQASYEREQENIEPENLLIACCQLIALMSSL